MPGDAGQDVDARRRINVEIEIIGAQPYCIGGGQRKRGLTQFERVDPQKQMVHHRVADKHRIHNQVLVDTTVRCDLAKKRVHARPNGAGHLCRPLRVHHGIADPAHQVFAKPDLRVHHA